MEILKSSFPIFLAVLFLIMLENVYGQRQFFSGSDCCEEYCYGTDPDKTQTRQFCTKTAYEIVKGAEYGRQYVVPNCKASKIWMLSRHGTRLPPMDDIRKYRDLGTLRDEIIQNYEKRGNRPDRGWLCDEDKYLLKNWRWDTNLTESNSNFLTTQGWNDLKFLAKNYQRIFPEILEFQYNPDNFLFRHSNTQRTEASYKAFVDGLFGTNAADRIRLPTLPQNDTLLRPYEYCPLWSKQDEMKDQPNSEIDKFRNSEVMKKTISDISSRLGFKFPLEREQIQSMWDMCRYEQAWHLEKNSPWCVAFTKTEINVLEYAEDLKYYFKSGYGSELNTRIGCESVQDMLKHLNRRDGPKAVVYFAHSSSIQLFLTALGIAKDETPLTGDNYFSMSNRKWKTSYLGPFAANLAAVKYDCTDDPTNTEKVIFFLNQKQVQLDWCNVGLCNWHDVKKKYEKFSNADCKDFFCEKASSGNIVKGSIVLLLTIFVSALF